MNQAQKNYIEHRINRGVSLDKACAEAINLEVPAMSFMTYTKIVVCGVTYNIFRAGPDDNPWYNFSVSC